MLKKYPHLIMSTTRNLVGHYWLGQTLATRDISSHIVKKAVYIALGYNLEGYKEILGMMVGENKSSNIGSYY
ncbi:MAG: transposase [Peptoniphilaceae bacterium]|nr:transposase [Peptoniphilaceae bacterium]